ncbi:MAG: peroxiredoxin [candidate division Zixibacteria bacterium]|nr:peroxiredoxin [candidate division Zixibacteria bacterium]
MTEVKNVDAGKKAPAFTLLNQDEKKIALKDLTGKWVVLYFYPRDNTSGCTKEACEFTDGLKAFEKLNAVVLGVSPDSAASHRNFIAKQNLKIDLLADTDRKVMTKYGAFGTKKMYGKEVQGVIRSTFLIDPTGKIAYAWRNVKAAGHAANVREKLSELAG